MRCSERPFEKLYASVDELQTDLDGWLEYYNQERPHRGYRNMGKRPIETPEEGKKLRVKQAAEPSIPERGRLSGK